MSKPEMTDLEYTRAVIDSTFSDEEKARLIRAYIILQRCLMTGEAGDFKSFLAFTANQGFIPKTMKRSNEFFGNLLKNPQIRYDYVNRLVQLLYTVVRREPLSEESLEI